MDLERKYLNSINQLLGLVEKVMEAFNPQDISVNPNEQDYSNLAELKYSSSQLSLIIFGPNSPFYINCQKAETYRNDFAGPQIRGILNAMKKNIEEGYLKNVQNQIFEEFSGDYLEMADRLNDREGLHIAAAVIAGTTLEERVRQLARLHLSSDAKANGDPDSVESLNTKLREHYSGKLNDQRLVTKEYGIRTEAAHGNWNSDKDDPRIRETHKALVKIMISSVTDFIKRNPV